MLFKAMRMRVPFGELSNVKKGESQRQLSLHTLEVRNREAWKETMEEKLVKWKRNYGSSVPECSSRKT